MAAEAVHIDTWLYGLLSADATLQALQGQRVYGQAPPANVTTPCTVFARQTARDTRSLGDVRAMTRWLYVVKAVTVGHDFEAIQAIADRIDVLLDNQTIGITGFNLAVAREEPVALPEVYQGNTRYCHLGGVYRIWCRPA